MKKKLITGIVASVFALLTCSVSASAIAVMPEPIDSWAGYQRLDGDIYMDESGETYRITPEENLYRFVLKPGVDAESANVIVTDILNAFYSNHEDFGVSRWNETTYSIYDYTGRSAENAEAVMQELRREGLISEFYTCGQLAARISCVLDRPLSYWSMELLDTEPLLQYLAENGIAGTVELDENTSGSWYHKYHLVLDEPRSQAEYFLLAADIREKIGSFGMGPIMVSPGDTGLEMLGHNALECPGDLNIDGEVDVSDAVLLARIVAEDDTMPAICDTGYINADVNGDGLLTILDVTALLNQIADFPA